MFKRSKELSENKKKFYVGKRNIVILMFVYHEIIQQSFFKRK